VQPLGSVQEAAGMDDLQERPGPLDIHEAPLFNATILQSYSI
jgi:hypothetical protein